MSYILFTFWPWALAALALGLIIGWITCTPASDDNFSGWPVWAAVLFVAGLFVAFFQWLPGRTGFWLETGLLLMGAYFLGCCAGCLLKGLLSGASNRPQIAGTGEQSIQAAAGHGAASSASTVEAAGAALGGTALAGEAGKLIEGATETATGAAHTAGEIAGRTQAGAAAVAAHGQEAAAAVAAAPDAVASTVKTVGAALGGAALAGEAGKLIEGATETATGAAHTAGEIAGRTQASAADVAAHGQEAAASVVATPDAATSTVEALETAGAALGGAALAGEAGKLIEGATETTTGAAVQPARSPGRRKRASPTSRRLGKWPGLLSPPRRTPSLRRSRRSRRPGPRLEERLWRPRLAS